MQKTESKDKAANKAKIRKEYLAKRQAMPQNLVRRLSDEISDLVLNWDVYQKAQAVFFYYPLGNEVSLLPVIRDALKNGKHAAFPKTAGEHMAFYEITDLGELQKGRFHVMEPILTEAKQPFYAEPDLCFVPGAVFDCWGGRFGYGKGYYDRYFAERKTVKLAGCAYGCQLTDKLPVDAWDIRMNLLCSESGIVWTDGEKIFKTCSRKGGLQNLFAARLLQGSLLTAILRFLLFCFDCNLEITITSL